MSTDERLAMVVSFEGAEQMDASLDEGEAFAVDMGAIPRARAYRGPYRVTPGAEAQTLPTSGATPDGDIVVEAIPSHYGLIAWDGAILTVS